MVRGFPLVKKLFPWCFACLLMAPSAPRAQGLPGEFILTQRWRDLLMAHSALSNPAFLASEPCGVARGAFAATVNGAFALWELGATVPIGLRHTLGVSWVGESDGTIVNANADAQSGELTPSGASVSNQNHFGLISYAVNPWEGLSLGANVTVLRFGNFNKPSTGYGLDLGATCALPRWEILGSNSVGLALQNIIAPRMGDDGLGAVSPAARLSWLCTAWDERIESGLELSLKDLYAGSADFDPNRGASWFNRVEPGLSYHLGFWIMRALKVYALAGPDYWGGALGVAIDRDEKAGGWSVLYQYMSLYHSDDAVSNTFYVLKDFGGRRGVKTGARRPLSLSPTIYTIGL